MRLVHVGMGGWGRNWEAEALPPVPEVKRVACVDSDESALAAARKALGLQAEECFTDLDAAFAAIDADAVLVTASMPAHIPLAVQAMRAGKDVLVEKPFAGSVAEAREAVDVAASLGRTLMVSQNYRFYPGARTAARLVRESALGPVGTVRVDFRKWDNTAEAGTNRHYEFIHPLLFDMAIHHFDLMRLVLGREPARVFAQVTDPPWSRYVQEAAAAVTLVFDGESGRETVVSYRGSWVSPGTPTTWTGDWHLECERGEIFWTGRGGDDTAGDVVTLRERGRDAKPVDLEPVELWGRSAGLRAFVRAVETGAEPETSGRQNLASLALMEAATRSAASGRMEEVEPVRAG